MVGMRVSKRWPAERDRRILYATLLFVNSIPTAARLAAGRSEPARARHPSDLRNMCVAADNCGNSYNTALLSGSV